MVEERFSRAVSRDKEVNMARKGKWVRVSSPREPVADVARRAIGERLALVWHFLRLSSGGVSGDTANVHQLRVSTRRAVAALKLFESLLPGQRGKWMLRQLKRVRRAAGEARDLDVMLARFTSLGESERGEDSHAALVAHLRVLRQKAQQPIEAIHHKLARKSFRRRTKKLVRRVKLRTKEDRFDRPTFAEAARMALEPRVREFFHAGEVEFSDDALLHAFRLRGKHLRYAMEVFASAFDSTFKGELYPLIAGLQERLGRINDLATARERFAGWLAEPEHGVAFRALLESFIASDQKDLEQCRTAFIEWWTPARCEDLRHRFAAALGTEIAGQPVRLDAAESDAPPVE
jgi:CHAD domain-containing protein